MNPVSQPTLGAQDLKTPSLVQRRAESYLLDECLEGARASGVRLALLVGAEGMGKTALISDFLDRHFPERNVEDRKARNRDPKAEEVFELDCRELSKRNAFSPVLALVARLHARYGRTTARTGPVSGGGGGLDMDTIEFTIGRLDPDGSQDHFAQIAWDDTALFTGLGEFVARHGRMRPFVVVLENLQDIGRRSADFLDAFLRSGIAADSRILVVAAYRGDNKVGENEFQKVLPRLKRGDFYREAPLSPLKPASIATFLSETLGAEFVDSRRTIQMLREATGGNPLLLEEVIQTLASRGKIVQTEEGWRFDASSEDLAILPEAMESRLVEKLPKLGKVHLEVLRWCAVARRPVSNRLVQEVARLAPNQLVYLWTDLVRDQYLRETKDAAGTSYAFTSSLVRQKVYDDLPEKDRKKRHLAIAKVIESIESARLAEVAPFLVEHFALGEHPRKEKTYAFLAGEHHLADGDAGSAARMLERALGLVGKKGDRRERRTALLLLGEAQLALHQAEAARKHFESARAESKGAETVECLMGIGETYLHERRMEKAVQSFEDAKRHLERKDSTIEVDVSLAAVNLEKNLFARALEALSAHPEPPAAAGVRTAARFLLVRGTARERLGEIEKGLADLAACRERLGKAPDSFLWARSALETLRILVESGRIGQAKEHLESVEDRLDAGETRLLGFQRLVYTASLAIAQGDVSLAHERASEARKIAARHLSDRDRYLADLQSGLVYLQAKKIESAQKLLRSAESGFDQIGDSWGKTQAILATARLLARAEKVETALRQYGDAITSFRNLGTRPALARALIERAALGVRSGAGGDAEAALEEAGRLARDVGDLGALALSLREEGLRLAAARAQMGARQALEESVEILERLGHALEAKRSAAHLERIRRKTGEEKRR